MGGKDGPHEAPRLLSSVSCAARRPPSGQGEQGLPRHDGTRVAVVGSPGLLRVHRPAFRHVPIAPLRPDRFSCTGRAVERGTVTEGVEKTLFEPAKRRVERAVPAEFVNCALVVLVQLRVGVAARQELEEELVQVEAAEQGIGPEGPGDGASLSTPVSVGSSPRPLHERSSGRNGRSRPRFCERARRAPRARRPTRPCSRVNASTRRLVSRQGRECRTKPAAFSTLRLIAGQST